MADKRAAAVPRLVQQRVAGVERQPQVVHKVDAAVPGAVVAAVAAVAAVVVDVVGQVAGEALCQRIR